MAQMDDFKAVVEAARTAGTEAWLPTIVEADLTTPRKVLEQSGKLTQLGMPDELVRALLIPIKGLCKEHTLRSRSVGTCPNHKSAPAAL